MHSNWLDLHHYYSNFEIITITVTTIAATTVDFAIEVHLSFWNCFRVMMKYLSFVIVVINAFAVRLTAVMGYWIIISSRWFVDFVIFVVAVAWCGIVVVHFLSCYLAWNLTKLHPSLYFEVLHFYLKSFVKVQHSYCWFKKDCLIFNACSFVIKFHSYIATPTIVVHCRAFIPYFTFNLSTMPVLMLGISHLVDGWAPIVVGSVDVITIEPELALRSIYCC